MSQNSKKYEVNLTQDLDRLKAVFSWAWWKSLFQRTEIAVTPRPTTQADMHVFPADLTGKEERV